MADTFSPRLRGHTGLSGSSSSLSLLSSGEHRDEEDAYQWPAPGAATPCFAAPPCPTPGKSPIRLSGATTPLCSTAMRSPSGLSTATTASQNPGAGAGDQFLTTPLLYTSDCLMQSPPSSSSFASFSHIVDASTPYRSSSLVSEKADCVRTGHALFSAPAGESPRDSLHRGRDRVRLCWGPPRLCPGTSLPFRDQASDTPLQISPYDNAEQHPHCGSTSSSVSADGPHRDCERSSDGTASSSVRRLSSSTQGGSVLSSVTGSDWLSLSSVGQPAGIVSRRGRSELFFLIGFLVLVFLFFGILLPFSQQPPAAESWQPERDRVAAEPPSGLVGAVPASGSEATNRPYDYQQGSIGLQHTAQSQPGSVTLAAGPAVDETMLPVSSSSPSSPFATAPSTSPEAPFIASGLSSAARKAVGDLGVSPSANVPSPIVATASAVALPHEASPFPKLFPAVTTLFTSLLSSRIFAVLSALPPVFLFLVVVALACCCACIFVSSALVYKHLTHYYEPNLQRYICRICLVGPAFAVASLAYFAYTLLDAAPSRSSVSLSRPSNFNSQFASTQSPPPSSDVFSTPSDSPVYSSQPVVAVSPKQRPDVIFSPSSGSSRDPAASEARLEEVFIEFLRDMAQAGALYSFLVLMINCCGSDRCISLTLACNPHPVKPVPPLNLFFSPFHPAPHILRYMKVGVMQCVLFVPLMGIISLLQAIARTDSSTSLAAVKAFSRVSASQAPIIPGGVSTTQAVILGETKPESLTQAGDDTSFAEVRNSPVSHLLPAIPSSLLTPSSQPLSPSDLSSALSFHRIGVNPTRVLDEQAAPAPEQVSPSPTGTGPPDVLSAPAVNILQLFPVTNSSEVSRMEDTNMTSASLSGLPSLWSLLFHLGESHLITVPALTSVVLLGSVFVCMLSLFQFYICTESLVRPYKPLQKFLSIKLLVFFQVWQRLAINVLLGVGVIQANPVFEAAQMADLYHNILMSVWMIFISLSHVHCFPVADHLPEVVGASAPAEPPATLLQSLIDVFLAVDVLQDAREIALVPHRSLDRACSILHDQCVKADNELQHLLLESRSEQDFHVHFCSGLYHSTPAAYRHSFAKSGSLTTPQSATPHSAARSSLFSRSLESTSMFAAGRSSGRMNGTSSEDFSRQGCSLQATTSAHTERQQLTPASVLQTGQPSSVTGFSEQITTRKNCSNTVSTKEGGEEELEDSVRATRMSPVSSRSPEERAYQGHRFSLQRKTDDPQEPTRVYVDEHGSHNGSVGGSCDSPYGIRCPAPPPCSPASGLSSPSQGGWVTLPPLTFCLSPRAEPAFSPTLSSAANDEARDHRQARGSLTGSGTTVARLTPVNHFAMLGESVSISPYRQSSFINNASRTGGQTTESLLGTASPRTPSGSISLAAAASAAVAAHYPRSATARAAAAARFLMTSSAASPFHRCPATALAVALGNDAALAPFGSGAGLLDGPPSLGAEAFGALLLRHVTSRESGSLSTVPTGATASTELTADAEASFGGAPCAEDSRGERKGCTWHTREETVQRQATLGEQTVSSQISELAGGHKSKTTYKISREKTNGTPLFFRQDSRVGRAEEPGVIAEQPLRPAEREAEPAESAGRRVTGRLQLPETRMGGPPCQHSVLLDRLRFARLQSDGEFSGHSSPSEPDTGETEFEGEIQEEKGLATETTCKARAPTDGEVSHANTGTESSEPEGHLVATTQQSPSCRDRERTEHEDQASSATAGVGDVGQGT